MEKGLKELLESSVLSEDTKKALSNAWNKKSEDLRESVKKEVFSEMKARFEEDKANFALAMNDMLSEAVKKYATETAMETKRLKEDRRKLADAVKEAKNDQDQKLKAMESLVLENLKDRIETLDNEKDYYLELRETNKKNYQAQLKEHMKVLQKLVATCLSEELEKLHQKAEELEEAKRESVRNIREHRIKLNKQAADRINQLDRFVLGSLKEELQEFHQDKRRLAEAKSSVILKYKEKLQESQNEFVERASRIVDESVSKKLKSEIVLMKEDIKAARENTFARRIYESFKDEFKTGYIRDNSEMKEMMSEMRALRRQVDEANRRVDEQRKLAESAQYKAKMSEERATRSKIMHDLLRPLSKSKREAMENLLESTRTANLKDAFRKYLPTVMDENVNTNNGRHALIEGKTSTRTVTGNKISRLTESANKEDQNQQDEITSLRKLAGIDK